MYAKGRKGTPSILDTIIECMKLRHEEKEESISLKQITIDVKEVLKIDVPDSSIRAAIYKNIELFVLVKRENRLAYYALNNNIRKLK